MIPKVIHRIWLGPDPLPEELERYGETWAHHHPGWEMRLWTDDHLPELVNRDVLDSGRNHSERSNVIRYELLHGQGGLYVDTDVECLRPIDPLVEGLDAFAAYTVPGRVGSAVVGAVPGHPAMARAVELVGARVGTGKQTNATGPGFLTEVLAGFPDVTVFGPETFYPYSWKERHRAGEEFPDAYAVHHWAKTWEEGPEELRARLDHLEAKLAKAKAERDEARRREREARDRLAAARSASGPNGGGIGRRVRSAVGAMRRRPTSGSGPRTGKGRS